MALFQFKWLRNMVRRNTRPMPFGMAHTWKKRLSIGYAILAWNALGFVLYAAFTGKADWAKSHGLKTQEECEMRPAVAFAKQFKIEKAKVISISGLKYGEYEIDNTTENEVTSDE